MAVTYKKLFHLLIDKGMTNAELMEKAGIESIEKICKALQCGVDDILVFVNKEEQHEN